MSSGLHCFCSSMSTDIPGSTTAFLYNLYNKSQEPVEGLRRLLNARYFPEKLTSGTRTFARVC